MPAPTKHATTFTYGAVIVDDEPLARAELRALVAQVGWLRCVGEAGTGPDAIRIIDRETPDLVFLDIRMPGASGLEVLERVRHRPLVIFTTAFDRYAVTAFELQAIDYLLKPFGEKRFRTAADRARTLLDRGQTTPRERVADALGARGPGDRFFVKDGHRIVPLDADRILRLEAEGDYVRVHTNGGTHLVHVRLKDFESFLDHRFLRVHRGHIVNLDQVEQLTPQEDRRMRLQLSDGTELMASRRYSRKLRGLVL